jgi:hypothetical protein
MPAEHKAEMSVQISITVAEPVVKRLNNQQLKD